MCSEKFLFFLTALSEEMRRFFAFQPLPDGTLTDLLADTLPVDALAVIADDWVPLAPQSTVQRSDN